MKKIAMFGGTFNPIHKGHIHIARAMQKALQLDEVLMIPTNIPPHKDSHAIAPKHRLEMCRIAARNDPFIQVSDIELSRSGVSYTVDTLTALKKIYPDDRLFLIVGSDMFYTLGSWRDAQRIFELTEICTGSREYGELEKLQQHANALQEKFQAICHVVPLEALAMSSTEIRKKISNGVDLSEFLDDQVYEYIKQNHCYQQEEEIL